MSLPPPIQPSQYEQGFMPGSAPPPPTGEITCCMCHRTAPAASAYTPYQGWSICGECLPAYRRMYPRQFGLPFFRERNLLAIAKDSQLPNMCIVCGAHGTNRRKKEFGWHEPWLVLTVLAGIVVYAILAIIMSKKGTLEFAYCPRHWKRRILHLVAAWTLGVIVPFAFLFGGLAYDGTIPESALGIMALVTVVSVLTGLIWGMVGLNVVRIEKIDDRYIFLKSLPAELEAELHAIAEKSPFILPWMVPAYAPPPVSQVPGSPPRMH